MKLPANIAAPGTIESQLRQLAAHTSTARRIERLETASSVFRLDVAQSGQLACGINSVEMHSPQLHQADFAQLASVAEALVAELNFLLEPLAVLEKDTLSQSIQLRSSPPHRDADCVSYFELTLNAQSLTLMRYRVPRHSAGRQLTTMVFTYETLQRLCQNLDAAAADAGSSK